MMSAKTFFIVVTVVAACDAFAGMQTAPLRLRGGEAWVPSAAKDSFAIPDGRRVCVLAEEKDIAGAVVECVETIGAAAIAEKGVHARSRPSARYAPSAPHKLSLTAAKTALAAETWLSC
eukprot:2003649-Rhodomonas_salina.1